MVHFLYIAKHRTCAASMVDELQVSLCHRPCLIKLHSNFCKTVIKQLVLCCSHLSTLWFIQESSPVVPWLLLKIISKCNGCSWIHFLYTPSAHNYVCICLHVYYLPSIASPSVHRSKSKSSWFQSNSVAIDDSYTVSITDYSICLSDLIESHALIPTVAVPVQKLNFWSLYSTG